jgi:predicted anti-sigma-YlaC factor YlaD
MMEHFSVEKWIDFANQAVTSGEKELMDKHLKLGCKSCQETVSLWQRVRASAAMEGNYQPPESAVRIAKAAFAGVAIASRKKGAGSRVKLLFDSFMEPILAGVRSAGAGTRQMLYRADPYQIDVQLEMKPSGNRIVVTGQLLNLSNPKIIAAGTRVLVSNMHGDVVHTLANQFGEFSGEVKNSGDLQLTFATPSGEPIVISLREALGRLPEEQA